jgi:hypothetical protein
MVERKMGPGSPTEQFIRGQKEIDKESTGKKMCEKCKVREATTFLCEGKKIVQSLCIECYKTPYGEKRK